jgi:hypothetical protein
VDLNRDFQEFLKSFVQHDVRFLIIGGYALAAHGHPRYTKDLDVWVWPDPANADRVLVEIGEVEVPFLSVDDLRTNKAATGRLRDLADVGDLPPRDADF